jgi:hypothetical protein
MPYRRPRLHTDGSTRLCPGHTAPELKPPALATTPFDSPNPPCFNLAGCATDEAPNSGAGQLHPRPVVTAGVALAAEPLFPGSSVGECPSPGRLRPGSPPPGNSGHQAHAVRPQEARVRVASARVLAPHPSSIIHHSAHPVTTTLRALHCAVPDRRGLATAPELPQPPTRRFYPTPDCLGGLGALWGVVGLLGAFLKVLRNLKVLCLDILTT